MASTLSLAVARLRSADADHSPAYAQQESDQTKGGMPDMDMSGTSDTGI
jgi:hypothetical protein